MMMDTAIQQQTDSNAQQIVTPVERQSVLQRLRMRWAPELAERVENQAYEKSRGIKSHYGRFVQLYFQQVQTALQNRNNQQQQQQQQQQTINNTMTFSNPPPPQQQQQQVPLQQTAPVTVVNQMVNQTASRFPTGQPIPRMSNSIGTSLNSMGSLREPPKFNPTSTTIVPSFPQPPSSMTTTVDVSQVYPSQRMTNPTSTDYSSLQPRFPNLPRHRIPVPTTNYPTVATTITSNPSSSGDQLLQQILSSNIDGGTNSITVPNRSTSTSTVMSQTIRPSNPVINNPNNSANLIRSSQSQLSPSPSVVVIPTSAVAIQPSSNIAIQQSPLSNNPQSISTTNSSPINRSIPSAGNANSDDEISNMVKYFKDNVNRLQILIQKFNNDGNNEKLRQVQAIRQQILQFIANPTSEALTNAKHFRDMLERISNRQVQPTAAAAPPPPPPPPISSSQPTTTTTANVFNQCLKATNDFLSRDPKERINVMKRYLEPLNDVINGVPHKIMRLDLDQSSLIKYRSFNQTSLIRKLNDEINQLPNDIFSIEYISSRRFCSTMNSNEDELNRNGFILRCKLIDKHQPIVPTLQLHIPISYPEQAPEILSLTKTIPPRLEFITDDEHPFFDRLSLIFVSHIFKLRPKHTITEILHIWQLSVQTAL